MKKFVFALLALFVFCLMSNNVYAADWSQYESIRNNVRIEGYQDMPGYIAFGDGAGGVYGIVWMSPGVGLVWCSVGTGNTASVLPAATGTNTGLINLETTKLTNSYGVALSADTSQSSWSAVSY